MWELIAAERNEFAGFLESLSPEEWNAQSLCAAWKVRDVCGHAIFVATVSPAAFFATLARSGFNFNRAMNREARARGSASPAALVDELRRCADRRTCPPGDSPVHMLGDTIVHQQDCRRPLGLPRAVPAERVRPVLEVLAHAKPNPVLGAILGNRRRMAGLRFVADDLDWSVGAGPEVHGSAEALLMALMGRAAALEDLLGEGVEMLRSRLDG